MFSLPPPLDSIHLRPNGKVHLRHTAWQAYCLAGRDVAVWRQVQRIVRPLKDGLLALFYIILRQTIKTIYMGDGSIYLIAFNFKLR